jgi:hypothetical protein
MNFSTIKRTATWISTGLAVAALVVFWGTVAYRMATGGNTTCGPSGACYDRFCLMYWLGVQLLITIGFIICLYYCRTLSDEGEKLTCQNRCWLIFTSLSLVIIIVIGVLCGVPPQL